MDEWMRTLWGYCSRARDESPAGHFWQTVRVLSIPICEPAYGSHATDVEEVWRGCSGPVVAKQRMTRSRRESGPDSESLVFEIRVSGARFTP